MFERHTATGLVVAEHASDERSVQAELRRLDPSLRLTRELHPSGRIEYVIVKTFTDDAAVLCHWRDEVTGMPLPLSHSIVDKVRRLDPNTRAPQVDAAAHNAALQDRVARDFAEASADLAREQEARSGRLPAIHRSRGLYLARQKARNRGEQV